MPVLAAAESPIPRGGEHSCKEGRVEEGWVVTVMEGLEVEKEAAAAGMGETRTG